MHDIEWHLNILYHYGLLLFSIVDVIALKFIQICIYFVSDVISLLKLVLEFAIEV